MLLVDPVLLIWRNLLLTILWLLVLKTGECYKASESPSIVGDQVVALKMDLQIYWPHVNAILI